MAAHGLLIRLRERKATASPAERNIIDFIQADPNRVVDMSIRELGEAAYVSPSTIVRLCRKLGCSGYKEFQRSLVFELTALTEHQDAMLDDITNADSSTQAIEKIFRGDASPSRRRGGSSTPRSSRSAPSSSTPAASSTSSASGRRCSPRSTLK